MEGEEGGQVHVAVRVAVQEQNRFAVEQWKCEAERAGGAERLGFDGVVQAQACVRAAEGGTNLFRGEADEQRGLANAGAGELFEQVREVRLPSNRCEYLGPIRDDRPEPGSKPTGEDRRRKACEL